MKLIIEDAVALDGSVEEELNESSGITERNYYLSGIFSTPEKKNRNGRVYPRHIWEREVSNYQKEIKNKTVNTLGEWQHPPRSTVDPMKAVMRITELKIKSDGNVWGKCKILNNNSPETNAIKGLIKEGIKIGISTRGVGKVSSTGVVETYKMITADLVDMPSDYNASLDGIVEGVEFINGVAQDKEYTIDEATGCVGEACNILNINESENEGEDKVCPIQAKIDESLMNFKKEIYSDINIYLEEAFKEQDVKREELIEGINDFLEINLIRENVSSDEDTARLLLNAIKEKI